MLQQQKALVKRDVLAATRLQTLMRRRQAQNEIASEVEQNMKDGIMARKPVFLTKLEAEAPPPAPYDPWRIEPVIV
jgi:hypothetical protein